MQEVCPISNEKVNASIVRITAGSVFTVTLLSLIYSKWLILIILVDFCIRGFIDKKYSLFVKFAHFLGKIFKVGCIWIDEAPKIFAAKLGFVLCLLILISALLNFNLLTLSLYYVLLLCSFLESAFGFCVGCKIYTIWLLFKAKIN